MAPGMRATVRPAVSSRSSVTTMKTYASLKEAQAAIAAEEAAAAAPAKAVKAPREPRAPREAPKPREPRATKASAAKAEPPPPPPAPLTAAEQRSAMEAELAAIQASRKAAEAELKAAQDASKSAKAKVGGGGGKVHQTPKQRAQLQRLDTQQEVKALKARVATLEKERHQTISSNRDYGGVRLRHPDPDQTDTAVLQSFITGLLCNILFGYALVGVGIPQPDASVIQIVTYWITYLVFDLPIP